MKEEDDKVSSVYYDNDFAKIQKLTKRVDKLELMQMELKAEREIRKKAENHIVELAKMIKGEE